MKKILLFLLIPLIGIAAHAQTDKEKIDKAFALTKGKLTGKVKIDTAEYDAVINSIKELEPMLNAKDFTTCSGANIATIELYFLKYEIIFKGEDGIQKDILQQSVLRELKVVFDNAFTIDEKVFRASKQNLYVMDIYSNYSCLANYKKFYKVLQATFGSDDPLYTEALNRYLQHIIAIKSDIESSQYYHELFTNFPNMYGVAFDMYKRIDALATDSKMKQNLKSLFFRELPYPYIDFGEHGKVRFKNSNDLIAYFKILLLKYKINLAEDVDYSFSSSVFRDFGLVQGCYYHNFIDNNKTTNENDEWFKKEIKNQYIEWLDTFNKIALNKNYTSNDSYAAFFSIYNLKHIYDLENTIFIFSDFDKAFQQKYLLSIVNAIKINSKLNSSISKKNFPGYQTTLKDLLWGLHLYFKNEKDIENDANVLNCHEEVSKSSSAKKMQRAVDALNIQLK